MGAVGLEVGASGMLRGSGCEPGRSSCGCRARFRAGWRPWFRGGGGGRTVQQVRGRPELSSPGTRAVLSTWRAMIVCVCVFLCACVYVCAHARGLFLV